jgi:hypothetical protein
MQAYYRFDVPVGGRWRWWRNDGLYGSVWLSGLSSPLVLQREAEGWGIQGHVPVCPIGCGAAAFQEELSVV